MNDSQALPRLAPSGFYGYLKPSRCGLRVWLREQGAEETPPTVFQETLMRLGIEHERRHLARFPGHVDVGEVPREEQAAATAALIEEGRRVIYQGRMEATVTLAGREVVIVGLPDFMLPARRGYAIRDSKLNRRPAEHITLQLETYGWLYEQTFGEPPVGLQIHAGSGEIIDIPYEDGGAGALAMFERILELKLAETEPPEQVAVAKCSGCSFHGRCWPPAEARRDIGLIPGADLSLLAELNGRGTHDLDTLLADWDPETLGALERPRRNGVRPLGEKAATRILTSAQALVEGRPILIAPPALPAHETWVMFDLEGVPPQHDELEKIYIWGLQAFGARPGEFRAATAGFGPTGDREGWESFLREAAAIFAALGDVPLVHWSSYEKAKIREYVARHGDRDGVAARVLDNLLDLLPITRAAVAVPLSGYGLKGIETLTGYERKLEEYGGDWSIAKYIEAVESDDEAARAAILDEILAYNREDLEATWAVLEWLTGLAA